MVSRLYVALFRRSAPADALSPPPRSHGPGRGSSASTMARRRTREADRQWRRGGDHKPRSPRRMLDAKSGLLVPPRGEWPHYRVPRSRHGLGRQRGRLDRRCRRGPSRQQLGAKPVEGVSHVGDDPGGSVSRVRPSHARSASGPCHQPHTRDTASALISSRLVAKDVCLGRARWYSIVRPDHRYSPKRIPSTLT